MANLQEFIKEAVQEKLFEPDLSAREAKLVKKLYSMNERKRGYRTEAELLKKLN